MDPGAVDDVVFGAVDTIGPLAGDIARTCWLVAGLPDHVPGTTVDRQCGSSQQAVHFAAQGVMSGAQDLVVAGGVQTMNQIPISSAMLAGQAYVEATSGDAPFDQLSLVGSSMIMRGYTRGRYRDRDLAAAQIEYRVPIAGRFGVAAFAGGGTVAPTLSDLASSKLLPSFGGGVRYLLLPKQRTTVRVDYGMGKGASGLYVAFNESF